ncbi:uncharacterized protein LOC132750996 [Ruditapes philippinarum]|uniref:uncharacterized protein LOC132750996 n=1 Tax=Ruditapes philippinarum TaxID=129788 RepID=UPI00295A883A|nr:uncharacterized protein LOC132750996 [Ruditapes philippinarum]
MTTLSSIEEDPYSPEEEEKDLGEEITADEAKLIEALRTLKIKPKLGSATDLMKFMKLFGDIKEDDDDEHTATATGHPEPAPKSGKYQYPRLSIFFGEEGKGEVTWDSFKYEVDAYRSDGIFKQEQILHGIRRALKGSASDKVRRLGPDATLEEVMDKLENDYGTVESRESVMRKFYSSKQKQGESVEQYASRLEELFDQAVKLGSLKRTDTDILKEVLHNGLLKDLKHMTVYQMDKIKDFNDFKRELRKIESDLKDSGSPKDMKEKTCKVAVNTESNEMTEVKKLLQKLNDRIDLLEKQKEEGAVGGANVPRYWMNSRGYHRGRGMTRGRGYAGRGSGTYNGVYRGTGAYRGSYTGGSYTGTSNPGECYVCRKPGHLRRDCPTLLKDITCFKCNEKGHRQRDCPKV